jgi:hypothetical protein
MRTTAAAQRQRPLLVYVTYMTDFDTNGEPAIAIAPSTGDNQNAQTWVKENKAPMLVIDGGIQFVLVYPDVSGTVIMEPFWGIKTQEKALEAARDYLAIRGAI